MRGYKKVNRKKKNKGRGGKKGARKKEMDRQKLGHTH